LINLLFELAVRWVSSIIVGVAVNLNEVNSRRIGGPDVGRTNNLGRGNLPFRKRRHLCKEDLLLFELSLALI